MNSAEVAQSITAEPRAAAAPPAAQMFFEQFELVKESPDGVDKLRELILDLAVRGKLVVQDETDEPAMALLERIVEERASYTKTKKLRPSKSLPKPASEDIGFAIPPSWEAAHLDDLSLQVHYGYTASANQDIKDVRMLRITDIQDNAVNWYTVPGCQIDADDFQKYELRDNDLLIARTGGTMGKTFIMQGVNVRSVFASYLIRVIPSTELSAPYLKRFLESPLYWKQLYAKSAGTGQPNVNATSLKSLIVPLPPLAEQRRIVSKVNTLMELCDSLEASLERERDLRAASSRSCLLSLTSPSPSGGANRANGAAPKGSRKASGADSQLRQAWQRLCDHFEVLFDVPETLADLRQTILQLAVQGKLVPQDLSDEPADELFGRLSDRRAELITAKQIKKTKSYATIDVIPHAIPTSWRWVHVGELARLVEYGTSAKANSHGDGVPVLRMGNIQDGNVILDNLKYVPDTIEGLPALYLETNDILFNRTNSWELVGKTGIFKGESKAYTFASYLIRVRIFGNVSPDFISLAMNAPYYRTTQIEPTLTQQCGQANFNGTKMKNSLVPLVPSAEQERIVSKVSSLQSYCDELERAHAKRQSTARHLITTAIHHLLSNVSVHVVNT